ncbi:hypothetical protein [Streptomyces sp. IBSBF 2435]|uniref:hypothetical protein n=1 Tax=Streptomyces sp. IBSBF 2435 TaxID=2903531 RepID=UPI002FDC3842
MLTFLALQSAPASRLRTVALSSDRTTRRRRRDVLITPLEDDEATLAARTVACVAAIYTDDANRRTWARALSLDDFLTCRIPGTDLQLGMSSRLRPAPPLQSHDGWLLSSRPLRSCLAFGILPRGDFENLHRIYPKMGRLQG